MAYQIPVLDVTFTAMSDLRTKQFCFVALLDDNSVELPSATTEVTVGVLQNKPNAGEAASVRILGLSKIILGATIAPGAVLATTAAGQAQTAVATQSPGALACEQGNANEIVTAIVLPALNIKA